GWAVPAGFSPRRGEQRYMVSCNEGRTENECNDARDRDDTSARATTSRVRRVARCAHFVGLPHPSHSLPPCSMPAVRSSELRTAHAGHWPLDRSPAVARTTSPESRGLRRLVIA